MRDELTSGDALYEGYYATYSRIKTLSSNPDDVELGKGASARTFLGEVLEKKNNDFPLPPKTPVVLKVPRLNESNRSSFREDLARILELTKKFLSEWMTYHYLDETLDCVARVVDYGYKLIPVSDRLQVPALFTVQEFITGEPLSIHLPALCQRSPEEFTGLPNAVSFFDWATKITKALIRIHQCQVIHGDIWQDNIMVRNRQPVFIDFGQALFRDLIASAEAAIAGPWTAPGGSESIAGDIFGLGHTFLYMAVGQLRQDNKSLPTPLIVRDTASHDELKTKIVRLLEARNITLYRESRGVADIIARCLRRNPHQRPLTAEHVLRDLELFSMSEPTSDYPLPPAVDDVLKLRLFRNIAAWGYRRLELAVKDMQHGCLDIVGDHQEIVLGMTYFLSTLKAGDQYLTASLPALWHTGNLGVNGRFLSMNYAAAKKGVTIKRVFLITTEELVNDPQLYEIISAQQRVMKDLEQTGCAVCRTPSEAGYYAGYKVVSSIEERQRLIGETAHFGLFVTGSDRSETMLAAPVYNSSGGVVAIQFRTAPALLNSQLHKFNEILNLSLPLDTFFEDPDVMSARQGTPS